MKDKDDIGGHSLIGNDDFLTAIDDEIAALIKNALLCILSDFGVFKVSQLTKLRPDHHRHFAEENFNRLELMKHFELAAVALLKIFHTNSTVRGFVIRGG